jgi:hypothetical protein
MNAFADSVGFYVRSKTHFGGRKMRPHKLNRRTILSALARLTLVAAMLAPLSALAMQTAAYPLALDPLLYIHKAKLTASDGAEGDNFGLSVSVSDDTVVVGARYDDDHGTSSGAAYVFDRNQGGADNWGLVKKLTASDGAAEDYFGEAVAVAGDLLVVGASYDDDNGENSGSAYLFSRNQGGADNWGLVKKPTASDGAAGDAFGVSVAMDGDTVVVGAYRDDDYGTDSGAAYVFDRNQGGADNWGQVTKLTAADGAAWDWFGVRVSIDGDTVVVGTPTDDDLGTDSGSVYVFARNQGGTDNWGLVKKLTASDGAAEDRFGYAVAISGDNLVVGAYQDDDQDADSGSAYVFSRNQGGADNWGQVKKLTASDGAAEDHFGQSVAVAGDVLVVGAYRDDDHGTDSGAAYVFDRNRGGADNWGQVEKVTASDGAAGDYFGSAVSASGDDITLGARLDDDYGTDSGSAYVFVRNLAPVADAGAPQTVDRGDLVTLDASGSSDPNGDALTYGWAQTGGIAVALSDPTVVTPTFTAPTAAGVLTFTLTVTDSLGLPDPTPDEVAITVTGYRIYLPFVVRNV